MKSIIITGANSGIGYECAMQMAKLAPEESIIIACRNMTAGKLAAEKIKKETGHPSLVCMELDLASLQSIRDFEIAFSKTDHKEISTLINNAGLQNIGETAYTKDGFEITFGTNHLGGFYLTQLLTPFMTSGSSVTFTASDTHDPLTKTGIEPPVYTSGRELAFPAKTTEKAITVGQRRYSTSKLCNVMTAYLFHEKLAPLGIRVNAFDPGMVPGTGLAKNYPAILRFVWNNIMPVLTHFKKNTNTAVLSGSRLANLAFSKKYADLNGIYFSSGEVTKSSADSYNKKFQNELWNSSIKLINN
ncbi:SDR family NAD(P)-dependent oxidoreductase [Pedobacter agri]|uniref:SDR family NAD(P)-dependent oxidoreductase n=1 Tax=Pedobacter agri TaxID=454586 RepID=UPI00292FF623|nr:SDR family NAD(P)-dependent oxidoreductase [Pedobacter agri]